MQLSKKLNLLQEKFAEIKMNGKLKVIKHFINCVENNDFEAFLKISLYDLNRFINNDDIKLILLEETEWLTKEEYIKTLIIKNNAFKNLLNDNEHDKFEYWVEIFKSTNENDLRWVGLPRNKFDFSILLNDKKLLDLFLSKRFKISSWFKEVDLSLLDNSYFENEKYVDTLFYNAKSSKNGFDKVIIRINKLLWLENKEIWRKYWNVIIDTFGTNIIKKVNKDLWFNEHVINYLIKIYKDYSVILEYYDDVISDIDLIDELIRAKNYELLYYINNEDFYKLKAIIVNRLNVLQDEADTEYY